MNRYAGLTREQMEDRLAAAELVCLAVGWSPTRALNPDALAIEKAAQELWQRWAAASNADLSPDAHPELSDDVIEQLARHRDEIVRKTRQEIRRIAPRALLPPGLQELHDQIRAAAYDALRRGLELLEKTLREHPELATQERRQDPIELTTPTDRTT